ncbi:hypothetical protein DSL72_005181 [Monilinia vaccinii-corymbosi]|uniref:2EXR domain-containing protein n=1 Tax=Monilinia vaccinii-corymbosi TaxID=61207 RepID=A0A8A3PEX4_9HELO|nr:hypothetical protein DSL72_005181 [Monilinia vaccinii-corymbosi]
MDVPSTWTGLPVDQLCDLNLAPDHLQSMAAAAIANMHTSQYSSPDPESTACLEVEAPIRAPTNVIQLPVTTETPQTTKTLSRFKELAPELRNAIWKLNIPGDRIVDIIYDKGQDKYLSFRAKIPSLLHVNREARSFAQQFYQLAFPTRTNPAHIWIRFDRDTIYFTDWLAGHNKKHWFEHVNIGPLGKKKGYGLPDIQSIQRVAVNSAYFDAATRAADPVTYFMEAILPIRKRMHSLKKLYIVVEDINPYQTGEIELCKVPKDLHRHPADCCIFCESWKISRAFKKSKSKKTTRSKIPTVAVVAAKSGKRVSHMGRYQKCACNGLGLRPEGTQYSTSADYLRNCSCEEYVSNESEIEDDLPEEKWGLSKFELADLIFDEKMHNSIIKKFNWAYGHDTKLLSAAP